jgi:hypothetical protein
MPQRATVGQLGRDELVAAHPAEIAAPCRRRCGIGGGEYSTSYSTQLTLSSGWRYAIRPSSGAGGRCGERLTRLIKT